MNKVDLLLDGITSKPLGEGEGWPLLAPQIVSYFDIDQALDLYVAITSLKGSLSASELGQLFINPTNLRYMLSQNSIIGLKLSDYLDIKKIDASDRENYVSGLIDALSTMVQTEPFVEGGKNLILDKKALATELKDLALVEVTNLNARFIRELSVDTFTFAWSFFYNIFTGCGYEIHGPYEVVVAGEKYSLVIRENLNMNPRELWDVDTGIEGSKLYLFYEPDVDFRLNFYNQPISEAHNEKLRKVGLRVDGRVYPTLEHLELFSKKINLLSSHIAGRVNSMSKIDQVKKGSEIAFYMYRKVFEKAGIRPLPVQYVEATYKMFGDKFLNNPNTEFVHEDVKEWRKIYDPRIDYLGYIEKNLKK